VKSVNKKSNRFLEGKSAGPGVSVSAGVPAWKVRMHGGGMTEAGTGVSKSKRIRPGSHGTNIWRKVNRHSEKE